MNKALMLIGSMPHFVPPACLGYELLAGKGTSVAYLGYAEHLRELIVQFPKGGVYVYFDVPNDLWFRYKSGEFESSGKFVTEFVKPGRDFKKLDWIIEPKTMSEVVTAYNLLLTNSETLENFRK